MSVTGYAGWPAYDTFLIVSLSGQPVYDPNPLRPNPNPKKPVLGSCRVRELGRILTPLVSITQFSDFWVMSCRNWKHILGVFKLWKLSFHGILVNKQTWLGHTVKGKSHQAHLFLLLSFSFFLSFFLFQRLTPMAIFFFFFILFLSFLLHRNTWVTLSIKKKHMVTDFSYLENQTYKHMS